MWILVTVYRKITTWKKDKYFFSGDEKKVRLETFFMIFSYKELLEYVLCIYILFFLVHIYIFFVYIYFYTYTYMYIYIYIMDYCHIKRLHMCKTPIYPCENIYIQSIIKGVSNVGWILCQSMKWVWYHGSS